MGDDGSVRVAVRIRPLLPKETLEGASVCVRPVHDGSRQVLMGSDRTFTFDTVFDSDVPQEPVFKQAVMPLVDACFSGYNATVLAYGQTGSGKTFTMGSSSLVGTMAETVGIIPRVITSMFERMDKLRDTIPGAEFRVKVTYIEVYGESIVDLLDPTPDGSLPIRENEDGTVHLVGVTEEEVSSAHMLMSCLERGSLSRTTAGTMMNAHSSRSHAIFSVILEQSLPEVTPETDVPESKADGEAGTEAAAEAGAGEGAGAGAAKGGKGVAAEIVTEKRTAKFHFVDLAGSERAKRTQAVGKRLREGIHINKGLLALGNVISALGDTKKRGKVHVPYRDSKLTRMLQDSLGGNSKTLMIACVSPADTNFDETLNALKYANRARNIKNKPIVNRDRNASQIAALKQEIAKLKRQIVHGPAEDFERLREQFRNADADVQRLNAVTKRLRRQLDARSEEKLTLQSSFEQLGVLYTKETGKEVPAEIAGTSVGLAASAVDVALDDEATRDVGSGVPADVIRKYVARIQALEDALSTSQVELRQAKATIESEGIGAAAEVIAEEERFGVPSDEWFHEQREQASASLDDIITRLSFGSHNSPLVKLARANLIKRHASPAAAVATARIISETKRDTAIMEGVSDGDVEAATTEALAEVEAQFQMKHGEMVKTMQTLSQDIRVKETAISRQAKTFANMKKLYEDKMAQMEKQIHRTLQERKRLQTEITNLGSAVQAEKKKLKDKLLRKLRHTEQQLANLKKKQRDFDKFKKLQARAKRKLNEVQSELQTMKRQRVAQARAMEKAKKEFRAQVLLKSREILTLRREAQKDRTALRRLQTDKERRGAVMKRRMEDLAAQNRRLKEAQKRNRRISEVARRTAKLASHARVNTGRILRSRRRPGSKKSQSIREKLSEAIKAVALKEQKNEELRKKLESRDRDLKMMEELMQQRRTLISGLDLGDDTDGLTSEITTFFGADAAPTAKVGGAGTGAGAGAAEAGTQAATSVDALGDDISAFFGGGAAATTATTSTGTDAAASAAATGSVSPRPTTVSVGTSTPTRDAAVGTPERKALPLADLLVAPTSSSSASKRRPITVLEAEALEELEERIEGTEARLRYNNELIEQQLRVEGGGDGEGEDASKADDDEDDADVSIGRVATLDEAKGIMRVLFGMVVDSRKVERTMSTNVENLKLKLNETDAELNGTKATITLLKQQHERQLARQQAEHAQEQAVLMSFAGADAEAEAAAEAEAEADEAEDAAEAAAAGAGAGAGSGEGEGEGRTPLSSVADAMEVQTARELRRLKSEYKTLDRRNGELHEQLESAKADLAKAKAIVASQQAQLNAATAAAAEAAMAPKRRGSRGRSTTNRSRHQRAMTTGDARASTGGGDDDIWKDGSAAAVSEPVTRVGRPSTSRARRKPAARRRVTGGGSRRTSHGKPKRPSTAPASGRPSLGGAAAGSAAASTASAAAAAGSDDDEFAGETFSSGKDLSKPLPQMNVFSRLSDVRSFTGTQRATHSTIALGRNEYHNADNNMYRRAKPGVRKKAWEAGLRSSSDAPASRRRGTSKDAEPSRASGKERPEVFNRLANAKNFTGTHKHRHQELTKKRTTTGDDASGSGAGAGAGAGATGSAAAAEGAGRSRRRTGSTDAGASAGGTPPRGGKRRAGAGTPPKATVRTDPLGTSRLVDLVPAAAAAPGDAVAAQAAMEDESMAMVLSPHLNVESGPRSSRAERARRRERRKVKSRKRRRAASYSPPPSPFVGLAPVEEETGTGATPAAPKRTITELSGGPVASLDSVFADIDLTDLEVTAAAAPAVEPASTAPLNLSGDSTNVPPTPTADAEAVADKPATATATEAGDAPAAHVSAAKMSALAAATATTASPGDKENGLTA